MRLRGSSARAVDDAIDAALDDAIAVFATGTTVARPADARFLERDRAAMGTLLRRGGAVVCDGIDRARDFHARPGRRPGQVPTASARFGGDTDIVRPVLVPPATAIDHALTGALFAEPVAHLRIVTPHDPYLLWDSVVTCGRRRHQATLHLLASPSLVVTVIELVPRRRIRRHRDRFVATGVAIVEELARRLERAGRSGPARHP